MGFLKKMFKKKPGGTFFGNLVRGTASKYTGGILGNGKHMVPLQGDDAPTQTQEIGRLTGETAGTYAETKIGADRLLNRITSSTGGKNVLDSITDVLGDIGTTTADKSFKGLLKKYWWLAIILAIPIIWLIFFLISKLFGSKKSKW